MGYIVFKADNSGEPEEVVGDSANVALTDQQKKNILEWTLYLLKEMFLAVARKLGA